MELSEMRPGPNVQVNGNGRVMRTVGPSETEAGKYICRWTDDAFVRQFGAFDPAELTPFQVTTMIGVQTGRK